jgi:phosphoribosylformylglycinamidine synthase
MRDSCTALAVPVVSGNVSFYNETDGVPIYPTPVIGMVGLLPKVERHVTPWFKSSGDLVVLLGRNREELGGSEYLKLAHGLVRGTPPWIDLRLERAVQQCCLKAIERGMIRSAHDISEGGLAVALVECCVGGPEKSLGVKIDLPETMRQDARLFGESQSRIIVSIKENDLSRLETIAEKEGVPIQVLGEVGGSRFIIQPLIQLAVDELKSVWSDGLERRLQEIKKSENSKGQG